jgi:peptide/nickel transport system permease protein
MYQPLTVESPAPAPALKTRASPLAAVFSMLSLATRNRKALIGFVILGIIIVVAIFAPVLAPYSPSAQIYSISVGPSPSHILGTTSSGQDIFSQLLWGTRETLVIAFLAGLFATVLAVLFGVTAAYLGGVTDNVLSAVTDIFLVIPALPLMIIIAALAGAAGGMWTLIAVISITGWSYGARQIRPQAQSLRNRDFLESSRVRGEKTAYVIAVELLPNMFSLIVAIFLGAALYAVLASAGLQFIGLGNPSDQSWGTMLYWANNDEALASGSPLWIIVPGACIALLGAAVALINYAVDEIGNPALRGVKRAKRKKFARAPADGA